MKKLLFFLCLTVLSFNAFTQSDNEYLEMSRDILKTEKKAAIADVMYLTEDESGPFWNLYNEYQNELYTIQNKRIDAIEDFADNFERLTDEKADELWQHSLEYERDMLKLKKTYYKKFKKVVPEGKAARFFQAEQKIDAYIDAELAADIPLIDIDE